APAIPAPTTMISNFSAMTCSESHLITALQREQFASLGGCCYFEGKGFQDASDPVDLIGVGLRQLPLPDIDGIFQTDADMSAHHGPHGTERHLVAPRSENGPLVIIAEELVGNPAHMHQVLGIRAYAAQNAEDTLHEERRLDQLAVEKVREVVEVSDIIALELEASSTPIT